MDVRTPDRYKMETLNDSLSVNSLSVDSLVDDFEKVRMISLEEATTQCETTWDSFQPVLNHLKRIGRYDKTVQDIHDTLSVLLYKYSYQIYDTLTEESHLWIEENLKKIRIDKEDRESLSEVFMRIRFNE